jgi:hypothetical protein
MQSLINLERTKEFITNNTHIDENGNKVYTPVKYRWTHGATDLHMGDGLLIYSLIQFNKAKTCVCIGTGGGYIPRLMTQARYDLWEQAVFKGNPQNEWGDIGTTIIVDANNGVGGVIDWINDDSFLTMEVIQKSLNNMEMRRDWLNKGINDAKLFLENRV